MKEKAPAGLEAKGKVLWSGITKKYDLRIDELRLLEDACFEADLIEKLKADLEGDDFLIEGSMGQQVANPLVQEVRQHRTVLARLLGQLKLPDDVSAASGDASGDRSASARDAAYARWRPA